MKKNVTKNLSILALSLASITPMPQALSAISGVGTVMAASNPCAPSSSVQKSMKKNVQKSSKKNVQKSSKSKAVLSVKEPT